MTTQELINAIKTATVDELAHIRALLRIPDADYRRLRVEDLPRDLGTLIHSESRRGQ